MEDPGPSVRDLLPDQGSHRSQSIWNSGRQATGVLRCYNYQWTGPRDDRILANIHRAGFYGIYLIGACRVDRALISALLDRWRDESHTFHYCGGEIGMSLQDVEIILGLRVDGPPVIRSENGEDKNSRLNLVERLLGVRPTDDDVDKSALAVTLAWMRANFSQLPPNADDETVEFFSRAAILTLLGSQYFSDKNSDAIPLWPLPFLEDFDVCETLSWGSALLAYLEHHMCKVVRGKASGLSGAVIFLEWWAYTRIKAVRPIPGLPPNYAGPAGYPGPPLGYRWARLRHGGQQTIEHNVVHYRDQFDQLRPNQIDWQPYGSIDSYPEYCTQGRFMWHATVPLICMEKIEWHPADRFKRQFGLGQGVPHNPWNDEECHGKDRRARSKNWPAKYRVYVTA